MGKETTKTSIDTEKYRKGQWEFRGPDHFFKLCAAHMCVHILMQYNG